MLGRMVREMTFELAAQNLTVGKFCMKQCAIASLCSNKFV